MHDNSPEDRALSLSSTIFHNSTTGNCELQKGKRDMKKSELESKRRSKRHTVKVEDELLFERRQHHKEARSSGGKTSRELISRICATRSAR